MKKAFIIFLCLTTMLCLSSCSYHPPEGWTKNHHTYEEVFAFAKTIDPNAVVQKEYTDTTDEYGWKFREWDAIINGIDCHVASNSDWVWNDGILAGEFVKVYYRIDTDYDYFILQQIVTEKQPDWSMQYDDIRDRYNCNDVLSVEVSTTKNNALSDEELETVWQNVLEIAAEYQSCPVRKMLCFALSAPAEYYDPLNEEYFVKADSNISIRDFSDQGKVSFFQDYHDAWALLDSDLRIER